MKYQNILTGLMVGATVMFTACEDLKFGEKFLDKPISNEMNIDSVFNKKIYAEQALAEVYHSLPDFLSSQGRLGWGVLETLTDLGDWNKQAAYQFYTGTVDGSNSYLDHLPYRLGEGGTRGSGPIYGIRRAYIYMENVDRVQDMSAEEKAIGKAEAKVIIAYHYTQMLRYYGGMPWIDHAFSAEDEMKFERMTVEQTVEKIVGLLDDAAKVLPWTVDEANDGHMTKAAALGLKSRVLLFAASPLFNADQPYLEGEASSQKLTWYGNYSADRWQKALDAGLDFLRENNGVYKLVNTGNPREDFAAGYFERHNGEVLISSRRFTKYNKNNDPFNQIRYGAASPTLNYINMFQMNDGTEFDWNNPDHKAYPFFDKDGKPRRDIRLYETLAINEDIIKGKKKITIYKGAKQYPYTSGQYCKNGAGMRKFVRNWDHEMNGKFYSCPLLRLPEIYLNIAEAMNELGKANQKDQFGNTAYDYLNMTRRRVNMPDITAQQVAPGKALREAILRERALEFGYEEVRYFDLMRWKREDLIRKPLSRLDITKSGKKMIYKPIHNTIQVRQYVKDGSWSKKYFLVPIPVNEINKKYGLIQNPGW